MRYFNALSAFTQESDEYKNGYSQEVPKRTPTQTRRDTTKYELLEQFHSTAYQILGSLATCAQKVRRIMSMLTFTMYAENPLNEEEINLVRGQSILGISIWVVVAAMKTLENDPSLENFKTCPKKNGALKEVAAMMESVVHLSLMTWCDVSNVMESLDALILRIEKFFHLRELNLSRIETGSIENFPRVEYTRKSWDRKMDGKNANEHY